MARQTRIKLSLEEDLSGLHRTQSALDNFHQSAASGFSKTKSLVTEMAQAGAASMEKLKQQVTALEKANTSAQASVERNRQAQMALNNELKAGTVTAQQHSAVLKQLQDRQKSLAQEAVNARKALRAARQELAPFLGGASFSSVAFSALPATPPFFGGSSGSFGLGSGGGARALSRRHSSGLAAALGLPSNGSLSTILGGIFSHGLGPISGPGLAAAGLGLGSMTIGSSNRAVSVLGGLGSGAAIGTSILPGIGTAVGAAIGGLVGLFTGGSGKNKTHDANIANQGFAQLHQILDDYYNFRRDYSSAISAAEKVWQQMASQWVRPQSVTSQLPYFNQIITAIQQTEDERNRRQQTQSSLALPEFATGGLVTPRGGMLAVVHPGEFVMTRQAVDRIGTSVLQGLNRGGSVAPSASAGTQISLEPASAQTLTDMLTTNPQALEQGLLVVLRRGGPASRMLRG